MCITLHNLCGPPWGLGVGIGTPPYLARFLSSLIHHTWLGFYFLHFLWFLAPWCIFVCFCSLARVLPITLVTKIICFPSVNLTATQVRWTLTYWAICHWYIVWRGVSSTHRTRVYNSKSNTSVRVYTHQITQQSMKTLHAYLSNLVCLKKNYFGNTIQGRWQLLDFDFFIFSFKFQHNFLLK